MGKKLTETRNTGGRSGLWREIMNFRHTGSEVPLLSRRVLLVTGLELRREEINSGVPEI